MTDEVWRSIPSCPGYEASNLGRIRSFRRGRQRVLAIRPTGGGYFAFTACNDGALRTVVVNRAVCEAFHGAPPDGHQAAHENGIRSDNRSDNLSWKTCRDNHADRVRHGTDPVGARNGRAVLTPEAVTTIRAEYQRGSGRCNPGNSLELSRRYGVAKSAIQRIIKGETWAKGAGA